MKVNFVLPTAGISGGDRVIATYAIALKRRGHEVFIVSQPHKRLGWRSCLRQLLRGRWSDPTKAYGGRGGSFLDRAAVPHVVLDRSRPVLNADLPDGDIVIATWWETAEWVAALSPSKGAKCHLIQHHEVSEVWLGIPDDRAKAVWRLPMHRMAVSNWIAKIGRECYGQDNIDVVPNAVDHELFCSPPRDRGPVPAVGFLYSSLQPKGCDRAVAAVVAMKARLPSLRVLVFGAGDRPSDSILPGWIKYRRNPPQAEISSIYASCDVWLFPSRLEGFGLPILEAMACRTPVVATPAGAAPELVTPGGGILVPHDDPAAMVAAIHKLLSCSPEAWKAVSDYAHATAAGHTWERSADLLEASLQRVLANRERMSSLPTPRSIEKS